MLPCAQFGWAGVHLTVHALAADSPALGCVYSLSSGLCSVRAPLHGVSGKPTLQRAARQCLRVHTACYSFRETFRLSAWPQVWFLYKTTETYDPVKEKQARLAQLAQAVAAASRAAQKRSGRDAPAARGKRGQKDKRGQQVAEDQDGPHPWGVVDGRLKLTGDCELPPPLDVPVEVMRPQPEASDAALYTGEIH